MSMRIAVFVSGGGTNLQALIDHFNGERERGARVALVIADRPCGAIERAERAGIEHSIIDPRTRAPDELVLTLLAALDAAAIDLIALAGYLRLVPAPVVERYRGRILNIHPGMLPQFGGAGMYGLRVHRAVLESGVTLTAATVHHVDERYDEGEMIAVWPVVVEPGDTPETLAARVLRIEHMLYPLALERRVRELRGAPPLPLQDVVLATDLTPDARNMRAALGLPVED
jgi:formyltetrahydrofolate-dependent phosphoribosylglycinamide formyltransferase